jgi:flagellar biogenesis protein FliO
MKKAEESFQGSNEQNIEFFMTSLSLIIFITSVAFLIESVL